MQTKIRKVAFISRATLYTGPGGDTVQIDNTAKALRKLGLQVDIFTGHQKIDYEAYDVLHGFNVIRPADLLFHFEKFKGVKALSPIYVDYSEYERKVRKGPSGLIVSLFGPDLVEYLKTVARWVKNGERNFSLRYLLLGHKKAVRRLLALSDVLLPNSESERKRLTASYGTVPRSVVVPNAVDLSLFGEGSNSRQKDLVICVGRIDGLKNQLSLIRALKGTGLRLLIIGNSAPNHLSYYEACRKEADQYTEFLPHMDPQSLLQYYQKAWAHVLPSWFETTGLSSLEAGACGCNVVVCDRGDTREYFKDDVWYCDPGDPESIRKAVLSAIAAPLQTNLRQRIGREYTWENAAASTFEGYGQVLNA